MRTGSFAEAARALGYTASAVSQQMMLLERSVGAPLFERSARSVRSTAVGELLAVRSRDALGALHQLEREVRAMVVGDQGRLRIGSFATANARVLPAALAAVVADRPGAEVHLDEGEPDEVLAGVLDATLDAAVVFEYDLDPRSWPAELSRVELLTEVLGLAVSADHRLGDRGEVGIGELADDPWICTREDTAGARSLTRLAASANFAPRIVCRSNDYGVIRDLVSRGLGVALLPGLAIEDGSLRVLRLIGWQPCRRVLALFRPGNTNPLLPLVLEHLTRVSSALPSTVLHETNPRL
ncbi:transcriptional regulator [Actinoalloteichus hymeniacidonis]|uniref:Transcriptional regulator n=1 Tax=Actinoalloteichus hymeniacidonis TaxID=340345 RepID=A0AAC9HRN9_9PSEU|nr:transcriptional regulator [Actinoalloteichus hymeniacidonis]